MLSIDTSKEKTSTVHSYLVGAVGPRPIAFASTVDKEGNPNLSPFSFFNCFSGNPPILVFSPARSGRTGHTKNTFDNMKEVPEVVINVVNYALVQQASLSSTEYAKGVNEFVKAGLTPVASEKIRPFRVKESPVQMECEVQQIIELGQHAGAGNLLICKVLLIHLRENILDEKGHIDQHKIDLVGRLGGNWYTRASGNALFEVEKPIAKKGIGVDSIPDPIRRSHFLSGNHLGQLGNVESIPSNEEVEHFKEKESLLPLFSKYQNDYSSLEKELHKMAADFLDHGKVSEAWKTLMLAYQNHPVV